KPTEEQLQAFFETIRSRFDQPEQVSFLLTPATDEATARRQLDDIRAEREPPELRDQTRLFPNRPIASLAPTFGDNFASRFIASVVRM
ncbi:MAG: hypothetical protein J0H99_27015, partial [Rhodospirillales bacterium]|nr:hypothetical protein [Rhodospirillales bacterium]